VAVNPLRASLRSLLIASQLVKPTIAELQSTALPLCYGAYKNISTSNLNSAEPSTP